MDELPPCICLGGRFYWSVLPPCRDIDADSSSSVVSADDSDDASDVTIAPEEAIARDSGDNGPVGSPFDNGPVVSPSHCSSPGTRTSLPNCDPTA